MVEKKLLLVINPCAGKKKIQGKLTQVIDRFNRANFLVTTYITAAPGDGLEAVARLAKEMDLVVCCGGDGTFNETLSGVLKSGVSVPVGYIPAGSTNDFASSLHLSSDIMEAVQDIIDGTPVKMDAGSFNDQFYSYIASFGAFTRTSYATSQALKNTLGHAAYLLSGIKEITHIKPYNLKLTLPTEEIIEGDFIFGAISNSTSVGGILTLDEKLVSLSDGQFELLLIRKPKSMFQLTGCITALKKKKYDHPLIVFHNIPSVSIEAPKDMCWTLDGENGGAHEHLQVKCLHHGIQVMQNLNKK